MLIIIDHEQGHLSLYEHNQSLLKKTRDSVNIEEIIALVDNTGGMSELALYFAIH